MSVCTAACGLTHYTKFATLGATSKRKIGELLKNKNRSRLSIIHKGLYTCMYVDGVKEEEITIHLLYHSR